MKLFSRFLLAAGLLVPVLLQAANSLTLSGSYSENVVYNSEFQGYETVPSGSAKISASIPLSTLDSFFFDEFDESTSVDISVGGMSIGPSSLGDDSSYHAGKKSATFRSEDGSGTLTLGWTASTLTVSGTAKFDAFGFGMAFDEFDGKFSNVPRTVSINLGDFFFEREVYMSGSHTVTTVTKGEETFDVTKVSASGSADMTPPTVTILTPAAGKRVTSDDPVSLTVQATDTVGVSDVWFMVSHYDWYYPDPEMMEEMMAVDSKNWQADLYLNPGTNYIFVVAIDYSGNQSVVATRSVFYSKLSEIQIQTIGSGTVSGITNGAMLEIGKHYTLKAKPAAGQVLAYWNAVAQDENWYGFDPNGTTLDFEMAEGLSITATFIPNPFPAIKGTYSGIFLDRDEGISTNLAGAFTITITTNGAYSGKMTMLSGSYPFSGQLRIDQDVANTATAGLYIQRSKLSTVYGVISFDLTGESQNVTGDVYSYYMDPGTGEYYDFYAQFDGELMRATKTAQKATYNLALPGLDGSDGPAGISYSTATIDANAAVKFTLNMADQIPVTTISSSQGVDGNVPFFAPLYGNKGMLMGWIGLTNQEVWGGDSSTTAATWIKPAGYSRTFYPDGFTANLYCKGSSYVAPKAGTNLVEWTSGSLSIEDYVDIGIFADVVYSKNAFSIVDNPNAVSVKIAPATGAMTGSFKNNGKSVSFKGVLMPGLNEAAGFFTGPNSTGPVRLYSPEP